MRGYLSAEVLGAAVHMSSESDISLFHRDLCEVAMAITEAQISGIETLEAHGKNGPCSRVNL